MSQLNGAFLLANAMLLALLLVGSEASPEGLTPRKAPHYRFNIPGETSFRDARVIPTDFQVSAFLYKGESKMYFFLNQRKFSPVTLTVTPCTSSVKIVLRHRHQNETGKVDDMGSGSGVSEPPLDEYRGREAHTFSLPNALPGLYTLQVTPLDRETYFTLYASVEPGGPHPLKLPQNPNIRLQKQQRKKKLNVKWEPSSVDPHLMHYCLVVNTRRSYPTLCEAQGDRYGVSPPDTSHLPREQSEAHKSDLAIKAAKANVNRLGRKSGTHEDILVGCVGRKTHYTVHDLEQGKVYHFNLFAVNRKTNMSFSYGNTTLKYDHRTRPEGLRDGKPVNVNLRQLDGRATFKFKVSSRAEHGLELYVMPCGGAVIVEMMLKRNEVIARTRVEGYERFAINGSTPGQRYTVRVTSPNVEELRRINSVEVLVTTRSPAKFPLPRLPDNASLKDYKVRCTSILVGWIPSPDQEVTEYFVFVRENRKKEWDFRPRPNQCGLDRRMKSSEFFVRRHQERKSDDKSRVMTQEIENLRPHTSYIIQVIMRKPTGKSLSYDLLQVETKARCLKVSG